MMEIKPLILSFLKFVLAKLKHGLSLYLLKNTVKAKIKFHFWF